MLIGFEKKRILKKDLIFGGYIVLEGVSVLLIIIGIIMK